MMLRTVITGYLNRLLREERYNALDNLILDTVYRIFRAIGKKDSRKGNEENRIQYFEQFVVTMSDQQLVTGYTLILASYMIRSGVAGLDNTISAYSYCMAVNLALLSCVTHLSSITILRSYHDKSPRLRDARTILMLVALAFSSIIFQTDNDEDWDRLVGVGYWMTLLFFTLFASTLLFSILSTFSWVLRRRYRAPIL
jgi:hypothetical protein